MPTSCNLRATPCYSLSCRRPSHPAASPSSLAGPRRMQVPPNAPSNAPSNSPSGNAQTPHRIRHRMPHLMLRSCRRACGIPQPRRRPRVCRVDFYTHTSEHADGGTAGVGGCRQVPDKCNGSGSQGWVSGLGSAVAPRPSAVVWRPCAEQNDPHSGRPIQADCVVQCPGIGTFRDVPGLRSHRRRSAAGGPFSFYVSF